MTSSVLTDQHDGVVTVTINRPESLNALTPESMQGIGEAVAEAATGARAVIITGNDRSFSSGADLQGSVQGGGLGLERANAIIRAIIDVEIPTIAAVSGPAAGIGCSLALACDYMVMSEESYLMLAFSKIGLMPDGGATALVAASAGRHRAMKMALTAEKVWAKDALEWGLASEVVGAGTQLERAQEIAATWAQGPPLAYAKATAAINATTLTELDDAFGRELEDQTFLRSTNDFAEGVAAFMEKRSPKYTGQ
ncbi:enoyl-CoA hydratase [Brevibacterium marinum]|uniref:Enoyl-CoA hydratase n=1 Tax=Brevibacterium marinum TaxID=418643 RepID=A0A846RRA0_9MICO|nr:enoyl-CoA hydratase [Brevibacterium marinum]